MALSKVTYLVAVLTRQTKWIDCSLLSCDGKLQLQLVRNVTRLIMGKFVFAVLELSVYNNVIMLLI